MNKKRKSGFTLTELIVVIAIIAILSAVLIPGIVGYINKARMSNDDVLIKQMNQILERYKIEATETEYDNTVSSSTNIRLFLKEFNINELKPSSNSNIFCFDEEQDKFVIISNDDLENNQILLADGGSSIKLADNPSSFDAIIDKHVIVSTDGHPLAKVVYQLYNLNSSTDLSSLINTVSNNENIKQKVEELLTTSIIVSENDKYITVSKSEAGELTINETTDAPVDVELKNKLLVGENVTELNLDKINGIGSALTDSALASSIVIPNNVEVVTCTQELTSSVFITGNIASIDQTSLSKIESSPEVIITENVQSAKGTWKAFSDKKNVNNFSELTMALKAAQHGAEITIKAQEMIVTTNIEIPTGVTVIVPLSGESSASSIDGTTLNSKRIATADLKYSDLIINEGITVNVKGQLIVAGVIGYPGQFYQGHTAGAYGQITCNGQIKVQNEGVLDVYGFIKGSGTVEAVNGGTVKQPFIVSDFSGGSNTQKLYLDNQSPFSRYTMLNIQTTLVINYGALLKGHCNLYALDGFNKIDAVIIGFDKEQANGLINLKPSSKATLTYDAKKYVVDTTEINNLDADYGLVNLTLEGGASFNALSMFILFTTISTKDVLFPLPYNYNFTLKNGTYDVCNNYILLPGSEVTVSEDATLRVIENAKLYVSEGITASAMGGKNYPTTEQLTSFGFSTVGNLIVNGKLLLENTSTFGGIVQTTSNKAVIEVKDANVIASEYNLQYGAVGEYNANTSLYTLSGRVNTNGNLVNLAPNCTYYGDVSTNALLTEYKVKYLSIVDNQQNASIIVKDNYYGYQESVVSIGEKQILGGWTRRLEDIERQANDFNSKYNSIIVDAMAYEDLKSAVIEYTRLSFDVKEIVETNYQNILSNLALKFNEQYIQGITNENANDSVIIEKILNGLDEYEFLKNLGASTEQLEISYSTLSSFKSDVLVAYVEYMGEQNLERIYYSKWEDAVNYININGGEFNLTLLTDITDANLVVNENVILTLNMNGNSMIYQYDASSKMVVPTAGLELSLKGYTIINMGTLTIINTSSEQSSVINRTNCTVAYTTIIAGCLYSNGTIVSIENVTFEGKITGSPYSYDYSGIMGYTVVCLTQDDSSSSNNGAIIKNCEIILSESLTNNCYTYLLYLTGNTNIELLENVYLGITENICINSAIYLESQAHIELMNNCTIDLSLYNIYVSYISTNGTAIYFSNKQSGNNPTITTIKNSTISGANKGIRVCSGGINLIADSTISSNRDGIEVDANYNDGVYINEITNTTIIAKNRPNQTKDTFAVIVSGQPKTQKAARIGKCNVTIISDNYAFKISAEYSSITISGGYFQVTSEDKIIDYTGIPFTATLVTSGEYNGYYQLDEEYVKIYEVPIA